MCTYVGSDVVLANLLSVKDEDQGVNMKDVMKYCNQVMVEISNMKNDKRQYFYFDIYSDSVDEAVNSYKLIFDKFAGKIYRKNNINLEYFNSRYPSELSIIFTKVARNFAY